MAASDLTAGTVLAKSASLLNDTARTVYTYAAQIPYLQMALQELREHFELNSIPVTETVSEVIQVDAGEDEITYGAVGSPALPDDMVEPLQLWERARDVDPFIPMTKRDFIPHTLNDIETTLFGFYVWQSQVIKLIAANRDNDIKIDYIREIFSPVVDENSLINVVNAATFLQYRTAGLCAEFIERNLTSANALNAYGVLSLDRATGIGVKGKQTIMTRRRPFRGSYKRQGWL